MTAHPGATSPAPDPRSSIRRRIQLAFLVVYVVWGVSYTVNRIMVLALPPLLAAGLRFGLAGALLACVAHVRRLGWPTPREWRAIATASVLGIGLANGISVLAMQYVPSNQAALVNASSAFWIAWLGMYGRRATPVGVRTWMGLMVGFSGVALLVSSKGFGAGAHVGAQLSILFATLCWAVATMVMRESHSGCHPLAFTACYLLIGGSLLGLTGLASGESAHWTWSPTGLAAIAFLAIFSSTLGFLAYTYLLVHETPARLGTYAFVNPLVAVLSGWLMLDERLNALQVAGTLVIFVGVALVRNLRLLPRRRAR